MLNWLTTRAYNRFDPIWFCWTALAWHDRRYFAAVVAVICGAFLSGVLEAWNQYSPTPEAKERT